MKDLGGRVPCKSSTLRTSPKQLEALNLSRPTVGAIRILHGSLLGGFQEGDLPSMGLEDLPTWTPKKSENHPNLGKQSQSQLIHGILGHSMSQPCAGVGQHQRRLDSIAPKAAKAIASQFTDLEPS